MDLRDLLARGVGAQGVSWALNTDAAVATKLLLAQDRDRKERARLEAQGRAFAEVAENMARFGAAPQTFEQG